MDALKLRLHGVGEVGATCEWPGCAEFGEYPAPRTRDRLRDFCYFCLPHIRLVNAGWDYFDGMSPGQIDAHRRADVTWHRPTWGVGRQYLDGDRAFHDWFDLLGGGAKDGRIGMSPDVQTKAECMMKRLGLVAGFSLYELKVQYKVLVKKYHPDLHAGDRQAEERLKLINEAYTYLIENQLYC
ncbi:MAG: DnaJ domain-containing protein [Pseudomonadota bacterium]